MCHHNSTTHYGYHTNRKGKTVNRPLRIISLNFQSIKNKKPELDLLLDTTKPDVIIGIETWLDSSISSSEYFPASRYTVYRRDRPPNSKEHSHGGVRIAINSEFDSTEVNSLQTDCEIVCVELTIQNWRKLLLSSFYGFNFWSQTSKPECCKAFLVCLTADLPAKSTIFNMSQFNVGFSWIKCLENGTNFRTEKSRNIHVFPYDTTTECTVWRPGYEVPMLHGHIRVRSGCIADARKAIISTRKAVLRICTKPLDNLREDALKSSK